MRSTSNRFLRSFIHVIDDDSLLNIFDLCRPVLLDEGPVDDVRILQGGEWIHERWWYQLTHVCRRWRYLILGSASHLGLSLLCTYGTPVADMLAHSPPFPLVIDHVDQSHLITAEDEEQIMLALQHHDRVRRIRLLVPAPNLQKFIAAIGKEFPILEYLYIGPPTYNNIGFVFPEILQAPHLRHLVLFNFTFALGSPLFATAAKLVTLSLNEIPPSPYIHPGDLLRYISHMLELQTLGVNFQSPLPNHDIERQNLDVPITTQVTLPNLRWFGFKGASAYLETLLSRITAPLLEKLKVDFFNQLTISIPNTQQFISSTGNLRFTRATLVFDETSVDLWVYPRGASMYTLKMGVIGQHHDWHVSSAAQIISALSPVFSTVVDLSLHLNYWSRTSSPEWHNEADHTQWREVLRSFNNVETLDVHHGLLEELSRSLQLQHGESPMELLPELKELRYDAGSDISGVFTPFYDVRRNAGRPFILVPNLNPRSRRLGPPPLPPPHRVSVDPSFHTGFFEMGPFGPGSPPF